MALVSILLAVAAFICTLVGFLTTPIPVLGLVFSFGAAAIALGGIMLGGRSISASKREGVPNDMGRIAVVLNVLAFIPALLVAVTCGVCNAIVSSGNVQAHRYLDFNITPGFGPEAGASALPPPQRLPQPDGPEPGEPAPPPPPGDAPKKQPSTPPPPSNLPPPPLPPGPAGK